MMKSCSILCDFLLAHMKKKMREIIDAIDRRTLWRIKNIHIFKNKWTRCGKMCLWTLFMWKTSKGSIYPFKSCHGAARGSSHNTQQTLSHKTVHQHSLLGVPFLLLSPNLAVSRLMPVAQGIDDGCWRFCQNKNDGRPRGIEKPLAWSGASFWCFSNFQTSRRVCSFFRGMLNSSCATPSAMKHALFKYLSEER